MCLLLVSLPSHLGTKLLQSSSLLQSSGSRCNKYHCHRSTCSWRTAPFLFQTQTNRIWSQFSATQDEQGQMKLVLHLCPKPVLLPQSCCDVSVLHPRIPDLHSQEKSRRHIFTLIEGNETPVADSLSPGFIFIGNPRQSRSWKSQSPKSSWSLQPSCQD